MREKAKSVIMAGLVGLGMLTAGLSGAMIHSLVSDPVEVPVIQKVPTIVEVNKTIEVPVEKIVEKEVVDKYLSEAIVARDIVDEDYSPTEVFMAEDAALALAIAEIEGEFSDMLEDEGIVADEDEVSIVKIYSDWEDVDVVTSDFEDNEYEFKIKVKVDDDDANDKFKVEFVVEVEDGDVEIKSVATV